MDHERWVHVWADGVYSGLRSEQTKLCCLVLIGVNEWGEKHFLAIEDDVRESTQSWCEVLLKLKPRGIHLLVDTAAEAWPNCAPILRVPYDVNQSPTLTLCICMCSCAIG